MDNNNAAVYAMMQYSKFKMATNNGICADSFSLNHTLLCDYHTQSHHSLSVDPYRQ